MSAQVLIMRLAPGRERGFLFTLTGDHFGTPPDCIDLIVLEDQVS